MEPDFYQVDILHYLNPHLIWVEVVNSKKEEFVFEQIGIYGILPLEPILDMDGSVGTQKCNKWTPAATVIMKNAFSNAEEVWFLPTHIDRRSSIFDNNIHKYGKLIIKKSNNKNKNLTKQLLKSGFAYENVSLFHQELASGNLKTKLDRLQTQEIVKQLELHYQNKELKQNWERSVNSQMSVYQMTHNFESKLTARNLEKHNRENMKQLLENKLKDFEKCKDVEEVSVGRANHKKKVVDVENTVSSSSLLKRKLAVSKAQTGLNKEVSAIIAATKKFLEAKAEVRNDIKNDIEVKNNLENTEMKNYLKSDDEINNDLISVNSFTSTSIKEVAFKNSKEEVDSEVKNEFEMEAPDKDTTPRKAKIIHEGKRNIAFGPPDISPTKLIVKPFQHTSQEDLSITTDTTPKTSNILQKKLRRHKELKNNESSSDTSKSIEVQKQVTHDSDDENIEELVKKLDINPSFEIPNNSNNDSGDTKMNEVEIKINPNPFKNLDGSKSVFVEKLISPILLVHTKKTNRIQPRNNIRDVPFSTDIHIVLRNMGVKQLTRLQSVSWYTILRGHSTFLISPLGSGKTMGYLPAVCQLVADSVTDIDSAGPSCIVVCATAKSVAEVEKQAKMFLGLKEKVLACYSGMNELDLTTSLLNGCDLLITTPCLLVRLLQAEFGVDLRRLTTLVLDDCERLLDVYIYEVKFIFFKVKEMLKSRANKELKVQVIVASRKWSGYLEKLAKKAPDTVVCFGAFQECVLYSKVNTTVDFIKNENKINAVLEFLDIVDTTKRTVIVCRNDNEVNVLEKSLKKAKYVIFSCNSTMTVQDLFNINVAWADYSEPVLGPILVCCDGNLNHLNVTDAHYLIHYSLPDLFSMFCKRFAVLTDNYPSIFKENNESIKIKVLLEEINVEQLPKILNFCKRCTDNIPEVLDEISKKVLAKKDLLKSEEYVPICDNLLALGECPDFWNCLERHAILKEYDEPKEWMPTEGTITFKVLYYHTPALFSARLLTNTVQSQTTKYTQTYSTLSLKMGMFYSKASNKRLQGTPKLGDVCAVAIKQNFFERCQILKILNHYPNGNPNYVLIKLIDEERYEKVKDIYLYYLPDELKNIETHIIRVRLANVQPKDKDVTFPDLATDEFKKITDKDDALFLRGQVTLTIGNCVFVDTLEACEQLTSLNETVVKNNFKKELLAKYAIPKMDHITTLSKFCEAANLHKEEAVAVMTPKQPKLKFQGRWAYLESDVLSKVYFASAENPGKFFVRLVKFEKCMSDLIKDIKKYAEDGPELLTDVEKGDIVIARFPDDNIYERARVEEIYNENNNVKCFFVDQGDWRFVSIEHLVGITKKFVDKIPFQAIECSLTGVEPVGDTWSEFSTNWLCDNCYDSKGDVKQLYIKYFAKDTAEITDGHKYSVALIDTNGEQDIIINEMMMLLNLAKANNDFKYINDVISRKAVTESESFDDSISDVNDKCDKISEKNITDNVKPNDLEHTQKHKSSDISDTETISRTSLDKFFPCKPVRSIPLVNSDPEFDPDRWDIYNPNEVIKSGLRVEKLYNSNVKQSTGNFIANKYEEKSNTEAVNAVEAFNSQSNNEHVKPKTAIKDNLQENSIVKGNTDAAYKYTSKITNISLDSDDLSSTDTDISEIGLNYKEDRTESTKDVIKDNIENLNYKVDDETRKPKLCWRQNKTIVYIKILLIGVENYSITINERAIYFSSDHNDVKYVFNFELYGGVHKEKCNHSNKGQYILVTLSKILQRNWLMLTKDSGIRKWIVYDLDSIDTSSDEEEIDTSNLQIIKKIHEGKESDSDDDEFIDDANFSYRKSEFTHS